MRDRVKEFLVIETEFKKAGRDILPFDQAAFSLVRELDQMNQELYEESLVARDALLQIRDLCYPGAPDLGQRIDVFLDALWSPCDNPNGN